MGGDRASISLWATVNTVYSVYRVGTVLRGVEGLGILWGGC